jgi:hypothetical protein
LEAPALSLRFWPILAKLAKNANAGELRRKGRKREKARNDKDFRIIPGLPITDQGLSRIPIYASYVRGQGSSSLLASTGLNADFKRVFGIGV